MQWVGAIEVFESFLDVPSAPSRLTVTVRVRGTDRVTREVAPTYDAMAPNGRGVMPTCRQADVDVSLGSLESAPPP